MEQVAAAPLPAPDQDARSGGRPSDRDEALNNGTFPGHAPPLFPAGTETLQDFLGIGILEVTRPSRLRSSVRGPEEGARPPPLLAQQRSSPREAPGTNALPAGEGNAHPLPSPRGPTRKEPHSARRVSPGCAPRAGSAFPTGNVESFMDLMTLITLAKF